MREKEREKDGEGGKERGRRLILKFLEWKMRLLKHLETSYIKPRLEKKA